MAYKDPEDHTMEVLDNALENVNYDCSLCSHINKDRITCDAYPDGIPNIIYTDQIRHDKHYRGDNGIQFERKEGAD